MFDEKSRVMLILAMLNDVFTDVASTVRNLQDFIASHPEMMNEIEKYELREVLRKAEELEEKLVDVMDMLKKVIYSNNK